MMPEEDFAPKMSRCRPCDAEYSRERRALAAGRKVVQQRAVPLGLEFSAFMAVCASGGGNANAPTIVRSVSIETINHMFTT